MLFGEIKKKIIIKKKLLQKTEHPNPGISSHYSELCIENTKVSLSDKTLVNQIFQMEKCKT